MNAVPRTSFVIPARNAARTIAQTLDSLLAQSDGDWQALIVDDGSSDDTPALIAAYTQRDARFAALRGNGTDGAAGARNVGLERARGRRIVFIDSDDWLDPRFLERMHAALDAAPGAAAAYCDYQRVMPDGSRTPVHSDPDIARAPFEAFARGCAVAIHTVLIERAEVLRAGSFDTTLRTCEDWDLWQRITRLGGRWVHVAEPLAFYRTSEDSLSQNLDRLLSDAALVIHRGFGHDPRLPSADGVHAAGASLQSGVTPEFVLAHVALWCCAFEAARRQDQPGARRLLDALPAGSEHAHASATTLINGVTISLRTAPQQLAARWDDFGPHITALIDALGILWCDSVAARRTQYAFERLLLQHDGLAEPRALSLTLGLRVNLRAPRPLTLPPHIDRLYVQLCDGARVLAVAEPGALGSFTPRQWLELAVECLGWRAVLRVAGPALVRSITPRRLGAAARSARGHLRHAALREQGWRRVVKDAVRDSMAAVVAPSPRDGGHSAALQGLREQVERAMPSVPKQQADAHADQGQAPQKPVAGGRRAFWDDFFRTPDPWNYGSAYEQEKYAYQLELLPEGPIETALELACAEGRFTERLAPRVQRLIATDISATALARAADRCRSQPQIDFRTLDLLADDLPQGLDLIVCSEVLYFLEDETQLRRVAARMVAALKPGGCLITAHALVLTEDMSRTGFDWGHPWGATTIARVFAELLTLEHSLHTELYRVDRFVRRPAVAAPVVETRPILAEIEHEVKRWVVWGGAVARRSELGRTERHQRIPVLAYHRIADDGPAALARYRVGAEAFGVQMAWLRRHGYHTIVADELAWFLAHQHPFVGRPVMITFDDGYQDFADVAWPLLRRHDFRAEVFIVTDLVGRCAEWDRRFGEPARLMDATTIAGARFGSHLATHRGADGLPTRELAEELLRSRQAVARWTGLAPCAMAAPFGLADQRLQGLAAQCGYRIGFSTESAVATLAHRPLHLPRIEVRGDMVLEEFVVVLEGSR
jgi:peptidoglycan/xylan/chitin deacetylase (PgdA/CDA1 family)